MRRYLLSGFFALTFLGVPAFASSLIQTIAYVPQSAPPCAAATMDPLAGAITESSGEPLSATNVAQVNLLEPIALAYNRRPAPAAADDPVQATRSILSLPVTNLNEGAGSGLFSEVSYTMLHGNLGQKSDILVPGYVDPEPASLSLLALIGPSLLWRSRRKPTEEEEVAERG